MYSKEQVLKEWDKIKAYDILDTIEELEALFREKPYGKCMRKYTAYPWCKENFFFGSPEELLEYYKNFTGIPFYMYYRIGQKFHSLTIYRLNPLLTILQRSLSQEINLLKMMIGCLGIRVA